MSMKFCCCSLCVILVLCCAATFDAAAQLPRPLSDQGVLKNADGSPLDNALDKVTQIGVIAQEVEPVFPELVSTDDEGYKSVAYEQMVALLIEAVKTLKAENDDLKRRVDAAEASNGIACAGGIVATEPRCTEQFKNIIFEKSCC